LVDFFGLAIMSTLIAATGSGLGGFFSLLVKKGNQRVHAFFMAFSAGIMVSLVTFDLLPHAFELGNIFFVVICLIIGVILIILVENFWLSAKNTFKINKKEIPKAGMLIALAMALHNFPEGIVIGASFNFNFSVGLGIMTMVTIHDITEGLAMALPFRAVGYSSIKVILIALVAGIPTGLGAFVGLIAGKISTLFIAFSFAFASGIMLCVVFNEILPEAYRLREGKYATSGLLVGVIMGIITTIYFG